MEVFIFWLRASRGRVMFALLVAAILLLVLLAAIWLIGERGHWILPSTRRGFRQQGVPSLFRFRTWHFYFYGRWPRLYIGTLIHVVFGLIHRLGERARYWLADHYHGKILTPAHARAIIELDRDLPLQDLERVIPYRLARQVLLQTPLEIAVYECPCRLARAEHCEPTQVCMMVGQPFVDLVLQHHPRTSRRLSQSEAVELLAAEHQRGHLHIAWFKDACLERFFAICNCCKCCCGGIDAMVHHGIPMIASSGFIALNEHERCVACGTCADTCVFGAISVDGQSQVDPQSCMGCGLCVDRCPQQALSLFRDEQKSPPLDVRTLATGTSSSTSRDQGN